MEFDKNGKFRILQLTDIHYIEGNDIDEKTSSLIRRIISAEKPDLIVITGDTVYGQHNIEMASKAFEPVYESHIPWTFVLGNHDTEYGHCAEELWYAICGLPGCVAFDDASIDGSGNHFIDVESREKNSCWRLMLLDSGTYIDNTPDKGYDYIKPSQIKWYAKKIDELNKVYEKTGAIAFFHIPLCEYRDAWDNQITTGELNEEICSSPVNSGMFDVMVKDNTTRAVFVGHDHINNFCGRYKNIILGYGRATGYNTYSSEGYCHGARLIEISEEDVNAFDTWQRLDDGTVIFDRI